MNPLQRREYPPVLALASLRELTDLYSAAVESDPADAVDQSTEPAWPIIAQHRARHLAKICNRYQYHHQPESSVFQFYQIDPD